MITAQQFMDLCLTMFDDARRYSGRGMYGQECVGIYVPRNFSMLSIGAQIMAAAHDAGDDDLIDAILDLCNHSASDSMGTGSIVYFPSLRF